MTDKTEFHAPTPPCPETERRHGRRVKIAAGVAGAYVVFWLAAVLWHLGEEAFAGVESLVLWYGTIGSLAIGFGFVFLGCYVVLYLLGAVYGFLRPYPAAARIPEKPGACDVCGDAITLSRLNMRRGKLCCPSCIYKV